VGGVLTGAPEEYRDRLRRTLGSYPTGVAVITVRDGRGHPQGMTVNSFVSLSLRPPLVLWCLRREAGRYGLFSGAGHFAVNVLGQEQRPVAEHFAGRRPAPAGRAAEEHRWRPHPARPEVPLLGGALAQFVCRTTTVTDGGDHVIVIGEVEWFASREGEPLVFHGGRYRAAARETAA
jgi:flavin reductase (DIM6/NTAB) family NADH-FMN oxidoreductase RutF